MKKNTNHTWIAGIDISKKTLDICLTSHGKTMYQGQIANTDKGLSTLLTTFKKLQVDPRETLFCCENTGIYTTPLLVFVEKNKLILWLETPITIKKSLGLTRGKTDKADAQRIADYAHRHQDKHTPWVPESPTIQKLKALWNGRKNILNIQAQLKQNLTEIKAMQGKEAHRRAQASYQGILKGAQKDLQNVEKDIKTTLQSDENTHHLHQLITSVEGVGSITAIYLIVLTKGFTNLSDPRKLACYAGVAPFPYTSGTSVRGQSRISPYANKDLKALLHMCAISMLKMDNKLTAFYQKKKQEGKHTMSIINALRNKILHIICACVRKNEFYNKNHAHSLA